MNLKSIAKFTGMSVFAACTLVSLNAAAGTEQEAYQSCRKAIANEVGVKRYSTFDRHYGKVKLEDGSYRFYINSSYRHPEQDGVREFRSICESSGFAAVDVVKIGSGDWAFNEVANDAAAADTLIAIQ